MEFPEVREIVDALDSLDLNLFERGLPPAACLGNGNSSMRFLRLKNDLNLDSRTTIRDGSGGFGIGHMCIVIAQPGWTILSQT